MSSGISRAVGNMLAFVACQIDILNKQLISPLSGNNPLSETSLDGSYITDNLQRPKKYTTWVLSEFITQYDEENDLL